ncbi:MAG: hypothetical protein CME62_02295 [Halobacteriovoraceae bacterium]|nr:hypothetical protein [Halobacteriovoraceae bacterium]|tara:strand:- start:2503 stop:2949 length:447 start_codon:yes stop_codon:yes gene_type:complete
MFGQNNDYQIHNFVAGDVIFKEGEEQKNLIVVKSGNIACVKLVKERLIPVGFYAGEGVLGEEGVLSEDNTCLYSAVALSDVKVIQVPRRDIHRVLGESNEWVQNVLKDMSHKIGNTMKVLADHRIVDDRFNGNRIFTTEEESLIRKVL